MFKLYIPGTCMQVIFTRFKKWVAVARHNFKWVKIVILQRFNPGARF